MKFSNSKPVDCDSKTSGMCGFSGKLKSTLLFACLLAAFLGCGTSAKAISTGFTNSLANIYWEKQPDLGSVYFASANSELVILAPTGLPTGNVSSSDGILYTGPGGNGLPAVGTFSFDWYFESGDALSAQADFSWTSASGVQTVTFGSGGPGVIQQGSFAVSLDEQSVFSFLLTTLNPRGDKTPARLVITNANYSTTVQVPDNSSSPIALLALSLGLMAVFGCLGVRKMVGGSAKGNLS